MKVSFDEIKTKIIRRFVENGEKKMEGMIYFDETLKSFLWCGNIRSIVLTMQNNKVDHIKYFKITKREGLQIE